jgi:low temperature requirement protein LtrA
MFTRSRRGANARAILTLAPWNIVVAVLLIVAGQVHGSSRWALWIVAAAIILLPSLRPPDQRFEIAPAHFVERHGLIVIIALGESIVAIGVGANFNLTAGIAAAAVLGVALAAAMWWAYFDVVALVSARRLAATTPGRERNEMARDSFSYLHLALVAGVLLVALGLKKTIAHVGDPLGDMPAFALTGGLALYLLGHVAIRLRNVRTLSRRRLGLAIVLFALYPAATTLPALASVAIVTALIWALIAYETRLYGEARGQVRHASG